MGIPRIWPLNKSGSYIELASNFLLEVKPFIKDEEQELFVISALFNILVLADTIITKKEKHRFLGSFKHYFTSKDHNPSCYDFLADLNSPMRTLSSTIPWSEDDKRLNLGYGAWSWSRLHLRINKDLQGKINWEEDVIKVYKTEWCESVYKILSSQGITTRSYLSIKTELLSNYIDNFLNKLNSIG